MKLAEHNKKNLKGATAHTLANVTCGKGGCTGKMHIIDPDGSNLAQPVVCEACLRTDTYYKLPQKEG
jgi:hypothetical protein